MRIAVPGRCGFPLDMPNGRYWPAHGRLAQYRVVRAVAIGYLSELSGGGILSPCAEPQQPGGQPLPLRMAVRKPHDSPGVGLSPFWVGIVGLSQPGYSMSP